MCQYLLLLSLPTVLDHLPAYCTRSPPVRCPFDHLLQPHPLPVCRPFELDQLFQGLGFEDGYLFLGGAETHDEDV